MRTHRPLFVPLQRTEGGNLSTVWGAKVPHLYLTLKGARDAAKAFSNRAGEVRLVDLDLCPAVAPVGEALADQYLRAERNCQLWGAELKRLEALMEETIGGPPQAEAAPLTPAPLLAAAVAYVRSQCRCPSMTTHLPGCKRKALAEALKRECEAAAELVSAGVPL